jgi:catechol-2,3-dioxygenase
MTQSLVQGFAELTLEVSDRAALERFYVEALGLEVLAREEDRTWLAAGPRARLGLWLPGPKEFGDQGGRHVHFAFSAEPGRLDALAQRLRRAGVEPRGPVEHPGGDRSIYVRDPEGNVVEVWDFFHRSPVGREGAEALLGETSAADPSH